MTVQEAFKKLCKEMNDTPDGLGSLEGVFQFDIQGDEEKTYQFSVQDRQVRLVESAKDEPLCVLQLSEENTLNLLRGSLNTTAAYMMGKVKIKGDLMLAMKLQNVFQIYQHCLE